jgi:hypothetical protein
MAPSNNTVVIDPATVSPEVRKAFATSKRLAVISNDPSVPYFAEALDRSGAYEVTAEEPPKVTTPTQRRALMRDICGRRTSDLVLSGTQGQSNAGTGASVGGVLTGRLMTDTDYTVELLRCSDRWTGSFPARVKLSQGVYNLDQGKISQYLGEEFAKAVLELGGKVAAK